MCENPSVFKVSVLFTSSASFFCERSNMLKGNKKALSPDFYVWPIISIFMCASYTVG